MSEEIPQTTDSIEETPVEQQTETQVEEVKQPDLSQSFADLKRQQRELRNNQQGIKSEIEEAKAKFFEELKADPYSTLSKHGISTSVLADQMLALPTEEVDAPESDSALAKELEELKAWRDQVEKTKIEDKQQAQVREYQKKAFSEIEQNTEKYELIQNSDNGKNLYWQTIMAYVREYGETPNLTKIAETVEDRLYNQAKKLLGTSKFQPKQEEKVEPKVDAPKSQTATISNSLVGRHVPTIKTVNTNAPVSMSSKYEDYLKEQKRKTIEKFFS